MIKRRIADIGLKEGISFIIMICLPVFYSNYLAAEESSQLLESGIIEDNNSNTNLPDVSEIKREIYNLNAPLDTGKISWIYNAISKCSDEEQKELNEILDSKMAELFKNNVTPYESNIKSSPSEENTIQHEQPADYESIAREIDGLKVGKGATVEDLRTKDKIISIISAISDPKLRYDLLEYLEKKERNAN
jgi:hypothetical protein